jgi:hypothetical protein
MSRGGATVVIASEFFKHLANVCSPLMICSCH